MRQYYVYILTNHSRRFYIGVTNDLQRRMYEHKQRLVEGFTHRYRINKLVHFEVTGDISVAIEREKQLKRWTRARKYRLIERDNPEWEDLSAGWSGVP